MSKRKSKKNKRPNIPAATMNHVLGANASDEEVVEDPEASQSTNIDDAAVQAVERRAAQREMRRRKRVMNKQSDGAKKSKKGDLDNDYVQDRLAHPTIVVTEEQLHEDYGFVLSDLRNMGLLAAVLIVVLIGLAQVL